MKHVYQNRSGEWFELEYITQFREVLEMHDDIENKDVTIVGDWRRTIELAHSEGRDAAYRYGFYERYEFL